MSISIGCQNGISCGGLHPMKNIPGTWLLGFFTICKATFWGYKYKRALIDNLTVFFSVKFEFNMRISLFSICFFSVVVFFTLSTDRPSSSFRLKDFQKRLKCSANGFIVMCDTSRNRPKTPEKNLKNESFWCKPSRSTWANAVLGIWIFANFT